MQPDKAKAKAKRAPSKRAAAAAGKKDRGGAATARSSLDELFGAVANLDTCQKQHCKKQLRRFVGSYVPGIPGAAAADPYNRSGLASCAVSKCNGQARANAAADLQFKADECASGAVRGKACDTLPEWRAAVARLQGLRAGDGGEVQAYVDAIVASLKYQSAFLATRMKPNTKRRNATT
jgi:hypothetical protein